MVPDWLLPEPPGPEAARKPGRAVDILLVTGALMVFYLFLDGLLAYGSEGTGIPSPEAIQSILWISNAYNLVAMLALPVAWLLLSRVEPWHGTIAYLRLGNPLRGLGAGLLLTVAIFVALIVLGIVLDTFAPELGENPTAEALVAAITWPLAIATALVAGIAEEVFFRGVLQRKIGILGQAVVFGLVHLGYGTLFQFLVPLALGLVFGFVHRRYGLVSVIVAHVLFDFVQFAAALSGVS